MHDRTTAEVILLHDCYRKLFHKSCVKVLVGDSRQSAQPTAAVHLRRCPAASALRPCALRMRQTQSAPQACAQAVCSKLRQRAIVAATTRAFFAAWLLASRTSSQLDTTAVHQALRAIITLGGGLQ